MKTEYYERDSGDGPFAVVFLNLKSNCRLIRRFYSPYLADRFANKIEHSKVCKLISVDNYC